MIGPRHRGLPRGREVEDEPVGAGRAILNALTEMVIVLSMALVLSLLIKTFLVQAFFIPSQSMMNTLDPGDRVVVSKLTPGPFALHRGDVVVFKDPGGWLEPVPQAQDSGVRKLAREVLTFVGLLPQDSGEHLVKRVIGIGGDKVACCDAQGRVSVNGVPVTEGYLFPGDTPSVKDFAVTVPEGRLWVMGDHRSVSQDSRYHPDGFVPESDVVGKAFVVVWPFSRMGGVTGSGSTFSAVPPS